MTFMRRRQLNALRSADRRAMAAMALPHPAPDEPVSAAEVHTAIEATHDAPATVTCPKCSRVMKKRGAHFHIAKCKGATDGD